MVNRDPVTNRIVGFGAVTCLSPGGFSDGGGLCYDELFDVLLVSNSSLVAAVQQIDTNAPGLSCATPLVPTVLTGPTFPISGLGFLPVQSGGGGFTLRLKAISRADDRWYDYNATHNGTSFTFTPGPIVGLQPGSGSQGLTYVGGCSPPLLSPSVFVCENALGNIVVYTTDNNEDPILASRQVFATFPGVVGAAFDRVTADLLTCDSTSIAVIEGFVIPATCICDFGGRDGVVNSQDFFDYLSAFFAGDPSANVNCDGFVNTQDFFDFLGCFFSPPPGC
jgi:hypothetical protein